MAYTYKHGDRPLDGITIQRAVGRGGFGEVYYALADSGKQVALKYLRENPEIELRGIGHVMNLKSPYLITIYDVRQNEQGDSFVIMEYVSGPSLRDLLIAEPNGLSPQKTAFFLTGVAKGLTYLHERGIVHRDLKPGNIFYDDGYVKIGDYGLSKHISVSAHSANTISVGTVHYMAPEIGSGNYTKAIDVYALGIMLYEMLTGRLPFTGSSMGEVLMRHLSDRPDLTGIPEPFAQVIARALAKDPNDRYCDVNEMVDAVTDIAEVSESMASFDPATIARVPRQAEEGDHDRTRTTPPKPPAVPVLDAREEEDGGLPPIPPIPSVLDAKSAKKARKLQRKLDRRARKAEAVRVRLRDLGAGAAVHEGRAGRAPIARTRWRQFVVAFIVWMAVSTALGIVNGCPVVFAGSLVYLLLGLAGVLIGYVLSTRHNPLEHDFQARLLYAATGFVFMLPAFAIGYGSGDVQFGRLIIPLTALLLLCDWTERIQSGRRLTVEGSRVFWYGVLSALIAGVAGARDLAFTAGVLAGTLLILVQTVAGLWPLSPVPAFRPAAPRRGPAMRRRAWTRVETAIGRAGNALESVGDRIEQVFDGTKDKEKEPEPAKADEPRPADQTPAVQPQPAAPDAAALAAYQPSFVGRTANAGLSFIAKVLLLVGLTVAVLFSSKFVDESPGQLIAVGDGSVLIKQHGRTVVDEEIPKTVVLAPLLLGTVLLVVARRNEGGAHFFRGFLGCTLAIGAAVAAVGPVSQELRCFVTSEWEKICDPVPLVMLGIILAVSFALLFWPKRRAPGPIVV